MDMRKRVLIGRDDADASTGETQWEVGQNESADDTTKVWIGKVCRGL